jgi:hypothetical protein
MVRVFAVSFLMMGLAVSAAFAQITIHSSDWRGVNSVYTEYEADGVNCPHGGPGANQTWTIPTQTWSNTYPEWWVAPSSTPYAGSFPTATFASTDPTLTYFSYFQVSASAASMLGTGTMEADTPLVVVYSTPALALPLPVTYNANWSTVVRYDMDFGGFPATFVDSTRHTMDGWGTLVTPLAENVATLRSQDHNFLNVFFQGIPVVSEEHYGYTWYAQDGRAGAQMQQTSDAPSPDPNFTTGDLYVTQYTGTLAAEPVRGPVAERFTIGQNYPNPFNPTTTLPVELQHTAKVTLSIYNETGRLVSTQEMELPAGSHQLPINGSSWASGTYFARVSADGQALSTKMMLMK